MAEGEKSEATIRAEMLYDLMMARYEALVKVWRVPFGAEEISGSEYKRRWSAVTPAQRAAEMRKPNWPEAERLLLGGGNA